MRVLPTLVVKSEPFDSPVGTHADILMLRLSSASTMPLSVCRLDAVACGMFTFYVIGTGVNMHT